MVGLIITIYDHLVLHTDNSAGPSNEYSFVFSAARNIGAGIIGALLGGSFLVFYVNEKYNDKPYVYTILSVSIVFVIVVSIVTLVMGVTLVPVKTGLPISHPLTQQALVRFVTDSYPIKSALVWSFVVGITQLLLQVSSKFGHGIFWKIICGQYNTPKEEERIFMFLDLNSSTTLAERLGNERYHELLKDFFADITNPILDNKGEIYQYVGDQVIVVWNNSDGLKENHCLQCFFDIKDQLKKKESYYRVKYNLLPAFKAGFHCGRVVAGEVGIVKRDITYSGDVLNTTARIQHLCGELNAELIASEELISKLSPSGFVFQSLGAIQLRGKGKQLALCTIRSDYQAA
jgi:adenylate cyclase